MARKMIKLGLAIVVLISMAAIAFAVTNCYGPVCVVSVDGPESFETDVTEPSGDWWWLKDAEHDDFGQWTFSEVPVDLKEIYVYVAPLVTNDGGGSGYETTVDLEVKGGETVVERSVDLVNAHPEFREPRNTMGYGYQAYGWTRIDGSLVPSEDPSMGTLKVTLKRDVGGLEQVAVNENCCILEYRIESGEDVLYLDDPYTFETADYGDGKKIPEGIEGGIFPPTGDASFSEDERRCHAISEAISKGVFSREANFWSRIGKEFEVRQGFHDSNSRDATVRLVGSCEGSLLAEGDASTWVELDMVLKEASAKEGSADIRETIFKKEIADGEEELAENFTESIDCTLVAGKEYVVYLDLKTYSLSGADEGTDAGTAVADFTVGYDAISVDYS